jgi:hypothetical protein
MNVTDLAFVGVIKYAKDLSSACWSSSIEHASLLVEVGITMIDASFLLSHVPNKAAISVHFLAAELWCPSTTL